MLVVTVEIAPKGDMNRKRHLGTAMIGNDATGDAKLGNYQVILSKWGKPKVEWKHGTVKAFPRLNRGPWDLLYLALKSVVGGRND